MEACNQGTLTISECNVDLDELGLVVLEDESFSDEWPSGVYDYAYIDIPSTGYYSLNFASQISSSYGISSADFQVFVYRYIDNAWIITSVPVPERDCMVSMPDENVVYSLATSKATVYLKAGDRLMFDYAYGVESEPTSTFTIYFEATRFSLQRTA